MPSLRPLLLLPLVLGGCDTFYSVGTAGRPLPKVLDTGCVEAALRATPGVTDVRTDMLKDKAFGIVPHWGKETTYNHSWQYRFGGAWALVQIVHYVDSKRERVRYAHYSSRRRPIPEAERAVLLPMMEAIDARLEQQCGLAPLAPERGGRAR